jgi:hypothetical protein
VISNSDSKGAIFEGCAVSVTVSQCYYVLDTLRIATLLSSSMAEHPAVNRRVVGSSPT